MCKCELCGKQVAISISGKRYLCNDCFNKYRRQKIENGYPAHYRKRKRAKVMSFNELKREVRKNGQKY